jgi:hypothetical protein
MLLVHGNVRISVEIPIGDSSVPAFTSGPCRVLTSFLPPTVMRCVRERDRHKLINHMIARRGLICWCEEKTALYSIQYKANFIFTDK